MMRPVRQVDREPSGENIFGSFASDSLGFELAGGAGGTGDRVWGRDMVEAAERDRGPVGVTHPMEDTTTPASPARKLFILSLAWTFPGYALSWKSKGRSHVRRVDLFVLECYAWL